MTYATKTLLHYAVTTEPFPLQASPSTGNLLDVQLKVQVSNSTNDEVVLHGIIIRLPVGNGATELTQDASGIAQVPPDKWRNRDPQYPAGFAKFTFTPNQSQYTMYPGDELTFTLNTVQVNRTPGGPVEIQITEGSNDCIPPDCPTADVDLTKFENGWGQVSFWANPSEVPVGGSSTLHWDGPAKATYTIEYYTPQSGVVNVPAPGQPPLGPSGQYPGQGDPPLALSQTTMFTLNVVEIISNRTYHAQNQVTVTAEVPLPTVHVAGEFLTVAGRLGLAVNWWTRNADYCEITGDPHQLASNSTDNGYMLYPSPDKLLLDDYTFKAVGQAGQVTRQLKLGCQVEVAGFPAGSTQNVVLSPDGSRACVSAGGSGNVAVLGISADPHSRLETFVARVERLVPVSGTPGWVTVSPDGTRFYVLLLDNNAVQAFDMATGKYVTGLGLLPGPRSVVVSPGPQPYVCISYGNDIAGIVTVLNRDLNHYHWWTSVEAGAGRMVPSPDGNILYVACAYGNCISALDISADHRGKLASTHVGAGPNGMALMPDGRLLVACSGANEVWMLDTSTHPMTRVGQPTPVPSAWDVAVVENRAFVLSRDNRIYTFGVTAKGLTPTCPPAPVEKGACNLAVTEKGYLVFVPSSAGFAAYAFDYRMVPS